MAGGTGGTYGTGKYTATTAGTQAAFTTSTEKKLTTTTAKATTTREPTTQRPTTQEPTTTTKYTSTIKLTTTSVEETTYCETACDNSQQCVNTPGSYFCTARAEIDEIMRMTEKPIHRYSAFENRSEL